MRIRARSKLIPQGAIVFDLDGVIIDQRQNYRTEARRRGYRISTPETNYNLIRQHVPREILGEIDEFVMGDATKSAPPFPGALEIVRDLSTVAYIATARPTEFQKPALSWLTTHLPIFPQDHVIFFPSTAAKGKILAELNLALYVDDQLAPLKALAEPTVRVAFDPDGSLPEGIAPGVRVVRSWKEILSLVKSTVRIPV